MIYDMKWKARRTRMSKKDSVILIGMPGAGKSTIGVILAKVMGYKFVDADIVIQQEDGRLLKDIIAEEGVEGFIEIENKINASICDKKTIIATGGSVVYGTEAMEHYKEIGTIVYLKLQYQELARRLGDIKNRGVVLKKGQDLKALYDERCPLYEKYADIIVDETGLNVEETLEKVNKKLFTKENNVL